MAITQPSKRSKADDFAAGAPDAKREPTLRGKRQPIALTLPPDLIAEYGDIARLETRSRARMMEVALRDWASQYRSRQAAA